MDFKDAMQVLGEKGITFKVNAKTSCVEFHTIIDGIDVKLGVRDKFDNYLTDFCVDNNDQMIGIVEMFADHEFLVPLQTLKMGSTIVEDCEMCDTYLNEIEELEMEIGRLRDDVDYKDDYAMRYHDIKNCF